MTVDFRARLICSLGTVIDGSVSRNHINDGSGLVTPSGTITLEGLQVPPRGATVELAYEVPQDGTVTRFPHPLRVLKASSNPSAYTTTVEVGCLLKLMSVKVDPAAAFLAKDATPMPEWKVEQTPLADVGYFRNPLTGLIITPEGNPVIDEPSRRPFRAQDVVEYCLKQVAIKVEPGNYILRSIFLNYKFDLSGGYVKAIGDLLRSECCYGYLNQNERFVVHKLPKREAMGAGPVIYRSKLQDMQPITGGDELAEQYRVTSQAKGQGLKRRIRYIGEFG